MQLRVSCIIMNEHNNHKHVRVCLSLCIHPLRVRKHWPIVHASPDVSSPSVVASFHGYISRGEHRRGREGKGVETIIVVEGAAKGRAQDDGSAGV